MALGTDGRKKPPCRAGPVQKKTKNEVEKTKNLKILLSGICCGAGFSQCTFGHSQIRLQTSGHECLLAQIPENWITFGKSLEIGSTENSFCSWKTRSFFHALDGTDVLGVAETTKMVVKSRPKKYTDRCQIACTFGISGSFFFFSEPSPIRPQTKRYSF